MNSAAVATAAVGLFLAAGLAWSEPPVEGEPKEPPAKPAPPPPIDEAFRKRMLAVAEGYTAFARVDDLMHWAPTMCAMPLPPAARFSASDDDKTHGRKIYSVWAKDRNAYVALNDTTSYRSRVEPAKVEGLEDCVQVLVKESFEPVEVAAPPEGGRPAARGSLAPAKRDGKWYGPGEKRGLFVMLRLADDKAAGTDLGWVYGTIAADGKTLTAAGRIASCMACHEKAPHGRLFGLPAASD